MKLLFALYTMIFCAQTAANYVKSFKKYHLAAKTANSICFIIIAIYAVIASNNTSYFQYMLPGFILCLVGDVLLAIPDRKNKDLFFLCGLIAFLFAHIAFLWALQKIAPIKWYDFIIPIIFIFITFYLTKIDGMRMQGATIPVLAYSFFVSLLFSKAVTLTLEKGLSVSNGLLVLGSFLFIFSDFVLLFNIFYRRKFVLGKFINSVTYFYGMFILAMSILYR